MDKVLKFLEEVGAAGGAGAFLLLASWGMLTFDLLDFKPANLATLPAVQLIATLAGALGLILLLHRLKQATDQERARASGKSDDRVRWERFASFLKDRRALVSLRDYEHLPYMFSSIDAIRAHLRDELQTLSAGTQIRDEFERLQEACHDFASACEATWPDRQAIPSHLVDAAPADMWRFCTAVGILRGHIAAMLQSRDIANTKALISQLLGRRDP